MKVKQAAKPVEGITLPTRIVPLSNLLFCGAVRLEKCRRTFSFKDRDRGYKSTFSKTTTKLRSFFWIMTTLETKVWQITKERRRI